MTFQNKLTNDIDHELYLGKKSIAIKVSNLYKRFEDLTAVNDVSFEIFEGEIVGILGPNGAGKTTTIRLLTGIFKLEGKASIEIFNEGITTNLSKYKINFGIVPEVSNAFSDFTVWQNLKFSGGIYGFPKEKIEKRSKKLLEQLNCQQAFIKDACEIIKTHHRHLDNPSLSFQILYDSDKLVMFSQEEFPQYNSIPDFDWNHIFPLFYSDKIRKLAKEFLKKRKINIS